jgi:hypothetical protein
VVGLLQIQLSAEAIILGQGGLGQGRLGMLEDPALNLEEHSFVQDDQSGQGGQVVTAPVTGHIGFPGSDTPPENQVKRALISRGSMASVRLRVTQNSREARRVCKIFMSGEWTSSFRSEYL